SWYVGLSAGPSFVPTYKATEFFDDGFKDRFPWGSNTGYYGGFRLGDEFGNWRAEGQFFYNTNPAAAATPLPPGTKIGGDTETFGIFGNVIYTPPFQLGLPVTPHLGVGFGALNVTTTIKVNDMKVFDSSGWAPGAQAIGGITYNFAPQWTLDVDYRYVTSLTDVNFRSLTGNRVTAPYESHSVVGSVIYHFAPPAPPPPAPPPPPSALPPARQVASLAPVDTAVPATAMRRFTLRYDEAKAALTPASVRALHDALDAVEAGQDVRIAIAGCEVGADYSDGSPCARHALRLKQLLARHGVEPSHLLVVGDR
ncbi:MAG TPA: outer membrane beta-barrel protein, partial [Stellaceae bacterium]|nr:outer membrane beta-barrel protein [Stellaceae bacterium]